MSLFQQKEYPQIYLAREIKESLRYPTSPNEPKKPKSLNNSIPLKYPSLTEHLQICGICLSGCICMSLLSLFISNWVIIFILVLCGLGTMSGIYLSIRSLKGAKTFNERMNAYNVAKSNYEQELEQYNEQIKIYLKEKKKFEERFNTSKDIMDYRLAQRQKFLQEVKSKDRHSGFYEVSSSNPKMGRAEYFFKNYIDAAKSKGLISDDFDFLYDTSVMTISNSGMKAWDFYPDILVLTPRGLLVNVEIDEPYVSDTKEPIHYHTILESSRDAFRNDYFSMFNCSVIRFSERQIIKYPEVCLNILRSFDDFAGVPQDMNMPDGFKEKVWTKEEAIKMAGNNYRDTY